MGPLKVSDVFGLSDGVFALLIIIIAIGMFAFAEWVEGRVKKVDY